MRSRCSCCSGWDLHCNCKSPSSLPESLSPSASLNTELAFKQELLMLLPVVMSHRAEHYRCRIFVCRTQGNCACAVVLFWLPWALPLSKDYTSHCVCLMECIYIFIPLPSFLISLYLKGVTSKRYTTCEWAIIKKSIVPRFRQDIHFGKACFNYLFKANLSFNQAFNNWWHILVYIVTVVLIVCFWQLSVFLVVFKKTCFQVGSLRCWHLWKVMILSYVVLPDFQTWN